MAAMLTPSRRWRMAKYPFTKEEEELLAKVDQALEAVYDGDPLKDMLDESQIIDALDLLMDLAQEIANA
jgi:hypothetical protein